MSWLQYLLEANLYLCVFYAGYYLLFSRETYYTANRVYLLLICVIPFVIPFLQLGFLHAPANNVTVVTGYVLSNTQTGQAAESPVFTWQSGLAYLYASGVIAAFLWFGIKLYKLFRLVNHHPQVKQAGYNVIYIDDANTAFSFFNYLFIGKNTTGTGTITNHELVHIRQKHSFDIVLTEVIKAVSWFNPFVYLLQNSLKTVHEYIADEQTASGEDSLSYSTFLLNNAYGLRGLPISNSFFNYNLLKKRIIMLNQKRSGSLAGLKYLLAVPLCGAMLCASTLSFSKDYGFVDLAPQKQTNRKKALLVASVDTIPLKTVKKYAVPVTDIKFPAKVNTGKKANTATKSEIIKVILTPPADSTTPALANGHIFKVKFDKNVVFDSVKNVPAQVADFPINTPFVGLFEYLTKHVRYPSQARANKTVGAVDVDVTIDKDGTIGSKQKVAGISDGCDVEVLRALNKYKDKISAKPGTYRIAVIFQLALDDRKVLSGPLPIPVVTPITSAGVVNIVGYGEKL